MSSSIEYCPRPYLNKFKCSRWLTGWGEFWFWTALHPGHFSAEIKKQRERKNNFLPAKFHFRAVVNKKVLKHKPSVKEIGWLMGSSHSVLFL